MKQSTHLCANMLTNIAVMLFFAAATYAQSLTWLGTLSGTPTYAYGVSVDGSVVVGEAYSAATGSRAFRWENGAIRDLGSLGGLQASAHSVSADGNVVVGWSYTTVGRQRAFRWENGVMRDLGTLGGDESHALGVSANGQVVVGWAQAGTQERAFRWENGVMQDLNQVYAQLVGRSVLLRAYAISPDGRYIVGVGFNASTGRNEAFLLDTGPRTFQISGRLELRDFGGDVTQVPIRMELRQGGTPVRTETIYLNANGDYVIPNVENGTYDLAFKASHWLRVVVAGIKVRNADVSGVDASLTNGDIDGDNEVTLVDFGALVVAFGSLPGDTMWNPEADLDGDGEVTLLDFGILVRNFGTVGDE